MTYENNEVQRNLFQETVSAPLIEEVVEEIKVEMNDVHSETKVEVEETMVNTKAKKKGGLMESLDWLRQKLENQFKDNIE
jgi:hypothetical protein